ncbi:MAG TPA: hypothetical protein PKC25_15635, partial [Candidatus Rifleibacterium sp.]|nr:hypothetical protein [Candidatus Rifleibacterium sp.]
TKPDQTGWTEPQQFTGKRPDSRQRSSALNDNHERLGTGNFLSAQFFGRHRIHAEQDAVRTLQGVAE